MSDSSKSISYKVDLLDDPDINLDEEYDPETFNTKLHQITGLLETRLTNTKNLQNLLPSKYIQRDPGCIRKYSNFSFPKDYKLFYDFVDYYPSAKMIRKKGIRNTSQLQSYLSKLHDQVMYNDFIDTLKIVSPKLLTLIDKIQELDERDMAKYGKKFKHFIFSDSKSSMGGVKLIASALIASGLKLGYHAKAKVGKKLWTKMELYPSSQLIKNKFNNFYMLCSKSVYDEPINVSTKKEILSRFNERPDNSYGENIRIIIMDGGYKEGIDLFDIKYVHIFEPTLTQADQKQVIGRGTRTCGQKGLDFHPIKGWPLYVYVYDLKMEDPYDKALGATTGIELYFKANNLNIKLLNFSNELETTCIQNAVDFDLNQNIHSFSISKTDEGESLGGGNGSSSSRSSPHSSSSKSRRSKSSSSSRSSPHSRSSRSRRSKSSSSSRSRHSKSSSSSRSRHSSSSRSSSDSEDSEERIAQHNVFRPNEDLKRSNSSNTSETVLSSSNTSRLNEDFFSENSKKSSPQIEYSVDKPLNAIQMRQYVKDYFSQYAWDPVIMENNCAPKAAGHRKGGATTIMTYTPTQAFISNFFTPENPLKGMLLWHSVGTGKTCSAIATATSSFEKQGYTILWVTRTTLKNDIWKNMFDQVCHEIIKMKIENQGIVIPSKNSDRMKLLSKSWRIRPMSYKQFSNLVSKKNQIYQSMVKINGAEDPLRKTLLIIDESHKLYGGGDLSTIETPDMVALHASLMNSYTVSGNQSVKLLLMTATPIQSDPMELIKLVNLFKLPTEQINDSFELFSDEYLNENGYFTPGGLHKFRNETAGYISYLNRERDARQFSQPVVSLIETNIYDKELLNYNKRATRKLYGIMTKDITNKLKILKSNPILKAKNPEGFNHLKKLCSTYQSKKAQSACKKIIDGHKKQAILNLKDAKITAKQELKDYKLFSDDFKNLKKSNIKTATDNETENPLFFRSRHNKIRMDKISSIYDRINSKCSKQITNTDNLVQSAIANNPDLNQIYNIINAHKHHIQQNINIASKEKNKESKKQLNQLIGKERYQLKIQSKKYKLKLKKFTKLIKKTIKKNKPKIKLAQQTQKEVIASLKRTKDYLPELQDKELGIVINADITKAVDAIELVIKEKDDKKHARTMKKMENDQKKLDRIDSKKAKEHARTMKKMETEKKKEDKIFNKSQKTRETELKKIELFYSIKLMKYIYLA